jgi:membrane associated rhomboid family serine protease
MVSTYQYARPTIGFGRPWTPAVRALILACGGVFLAQLLFPAIPFDLYFGMDSTRPWELWRWVTYLFLHGGVLHLVFNMFALWMFGSDVEERLGTRRFVGYYFLTGAGAAVSVIAVDALVGQSSLVIGASGAVFGILLAFGVLFAERVITLLLFFVLPVSMRAKYFVIIYGVLELLYGISGASRTAHFAHLGGMVFGYLLLKMPAASRPRGGPGLFRRLGDRFAALTRVRDDQRLDALLRKVNEKGIGSLSDGEKRFLHRMSRRKRWQ